LIIITQTIGTDCGWDEPKNARAAGIEIDVAKLPLSDVPHVLATDEDHHGELFIHLVTNANQIDADSCVGFNLAWTAIEQGHEVTIFFDSWAAYNIKNGDYWEKYTVPKGLTKVVAENVGHDLASTRGYIRF